MKQQRETYRAETHSRAEIMRELNSVTCILQSCKQDIAAAKRAVATGGKHMPPAEFQALETRRIKLARKIKALQLELSRKKELQSHTGHENV